MPSKESYEAGRAALNLSAAQFVQAYHAQHGQIEEYSASHNTFEYSKEFFGSSEACLIAQTIVSIKATPLIIPQCERFNHSIIRTVEA